MFPATLNGKTILFTGLGESSHLTLTAVRIAVRQALGSSLLTKAKTVEILPHFSDDKTVNATIEGTLIGAYSWRKYISAKDNKAVPDKEIFLIAPDKQIFRDAVITCAGVNLARDLVNDNADTVDSSYLENAVRQIIKGQKTFRSTSSTKKN